MNKLSVIVGYRDLMMKMTLQDSLLLKQIQAVQGIGRLIKFQCELLRLRHTVNSRPQAGKASAS